MKTIVLTILFLFIFLSGPALYGEKTGQTSSTDAEMIGKIHAFLTRSYPADQPGAAVLVARGEETVFRNSYSEN